MQKLKKIQGTVLDIGLEHFLDMTLEAQKQKPTSDDIKLKRFCTAKETANEKTTDGMGENI